MKKISKVTHQIISSVKAMVENKSYSKDLPKDFIKNMYKPHVYLFIAGMGGVTTMEGLGIVLKTLRSTATNGIYFQVKIPYHRYRTHVYLSSDAGMEKYDLFIFKDYASFKESKPEHIALNLTANVLNSVISSLLRYKTNPSDVLSQMVNVKKVRDTERHSMLREHFRKSYQWMHMLKRIAQSEILIEDVRVGYQWDDEDTEMAIAANAYLDGYQHALEDMKTHKRFVEKSASQNRFSDRGMNISLALAVKKAKKMMNKTEDIGLDTEIFMEDLNG
jgi:hypothetical protein